MVYTCKPYSLANGLAMFSENMENVVHYCSKFAEVINSSQSKIQELQGWVIKDVEVFKAGTWRGVSYTEKDLQDIVDNFYALKGKLDPVFKVNHSEDVRDQIGWILEVRKSGELLLADLHVTEWEAYDKIRNGTWKKVSAEIYLPALAESEFGINAYILRAVAVVSVPQIKDIQGIVLNAEAWAADPDPEQNKGGSFRMKWEEFLQMLSELGITLTDEQTTQLKAKGVAAFTEVSGQAPQTIVIGASEILSLAEQIKTLKDSEGDLQVKLAELFTQSKKTETAAWFDGLLQAGKALPAEREKVLALAEKLDEAGLAAYKETFDVRPKLVDLEQNGSGDPGQHDEDEKAHAAYSEQFAQKTYQ